MPNSLDHLSSPRGDKRKAPEEQDFVQEKEKKQRSLDHLSSPRGDHKPPEEQDFVRISPPETRGDKSNSRELYKLQNITEDVYKLLTRVTEGFATYNVMIADQGFKSTQLPFKELHAASRDLRSIEQQINTKGISVNLDDLTKQLQVLKHTVNTTLHRLQNPFEAAPEPTFGGAFTESPRPFSTPLPKEGSSGAGVFPVGRATVPFGWRDMNAPPPPGASDSRTWPYPASRNDATGQQPRWDTADPTGGDNPSAGLFPVPFEETNIGWETFFQPEDEH